jgi:hypothetical protein
MGVECAALPVAIGQADKKEIPLFPPFAKGDEWGIIESTHYPVTSYCFEA